MSITADKLYKKLKDTPEDIVLEINDFAEFLISKRSIEKIDQRKSVQSFIGVLKDDAIFSGDPVEIQKKMRNEWN